MDELRRRARDLRNNSTDAERHLWRHLGRTNLEGCKFRRQYPTCGFIVDFVCLSRMVVIELDGGQHTDAVPYDEARTRKLNAAGFRVLRFWNNDVLQQTEAVLEAIWSALTVQKVDGTKG